MAQLVLKLVRNGSLRGMVAPDKTQRFAVFEFITVGCNYGDTGATARKEFNRLISDGSEFKDELLGLCQYHKFPGPGQRETPTMTIRGLIRLLQILGGKVALEFRREVEEIFTRYTAGDFTMIEEVKSNSISSEPLHVVFRNALAAEPIQVAIPGAPEMVTGKNNNGAVDKVAVDAGAGGYEGGPVEFAITKRRLEREDALLELEIEERRMALEIKRREMEEKCRNMGENHKALEQSNRTLALDNVKKGLDIVRSIYPAGPIDQRFALQMEDLVKNILLPSGGPPIQSRQLQVTDGVEAGTSSSLGSGGACGAGAPLSASSSQTQVNPTQAISVSVVMASMGYIGKGSKSQSMAIGRLAAAKYRTKYGEEPPKHGQYVDGNFIMVNSYTEKDRDLLEEAVREVIASGK